MGYKRKYHMHRIGVRTFTILISHLGICLNWGTSMLDGASEQSYKASWTSSFRFHIQPKHFLKVPLLEGKAVIISGV